MNILLQLISKLKTSLFGAPQSSQLGAPQSSQGLYRVSSKDDGNCFYYSVAATLNAELGKEQYTQQQLRDQVSCFWSQQISSNGKYLHVLKLAVIEWLGKSSKIKTQRPSNQQMFEYINLIKNSRIWANESAVIALALSLDRPIITLVTATLDPCKLEIYNKSGILNTRGLPIFVYYNGNNHYDALLVCPNRTLEEVAQEICPDWQKAREKTTNHYEDTTISISSSSDSESLDSEQRRREKRPRAVIINNKKRSLSQQYATSTAASNSKKSKKIAT